MVSLIRNKVTKLGQSLAHWLVLIFIITSCDKDFPFDFKTITTGQYKIKIIGKLDKKIDESSGITRATDSTFWTHNDGPDNHLYEINRKGILKSEVEISKAKFVDFEEICSDQQGNHYLGDFGNNNNKRKNLRIYKVNSNFSKIDTIHFSYPDQYEFPPKKAFKNFDCEAFIYFNGHLYLFSKNRGNKKVKLYQLPTKAGRYKAKLLDSIYLTGMITSASINPSQTKLALLSYNSVYLFAIDNQVSLKSHYKVIKLPQVGQVEGILFINDKDFLITNEARKIFLAKAK